MRWLLFMACLTVPLRAELMREAFPVPPAVAAAFNSGGLAAFDPFDTWDGENLRPARSMTPASTGEDGARLPFGECYDVLPAWTARGFKPHHGTRVLYHPRTQMLFATAAPEDEAQVRAFCEWPAVVWMYSAGWGSGYGVKQVLYRLTAYEVPAIGPGGWDFQPATASELLALPASARRILARHSMIIRGGQRSKVEGIAAPAQNCQTNLSGMVVEAECTVGEDGWTVDLSNAPELKVACDNGKHALLSTQFQQLIRWGDSWLLEAGTLPGDPPRRIFHLYECLRVNDEEKEARAIARCRELWTGRTEQSNVLGRALVLSDFPRYEPPLLPPPAGMPEAGVPPASSHSPPAERVPELFGNAPVQNYSDTLIKATGAPPGSVQAWCPEGYSNPWFIRGTPEGITALDGWLGKQKVNNYTGQALVENTVSVQPPGGERRIVWRNSITVRSGQRSSVTLDLADRTNPDEDSHLACLLDVEATRESPPKDNPDSTENDLWKLTVAGVLNAPLVDRSVKVPEATETGTSDAVNLRRFLGYLKTGEEVVLSCRLRDVPLPSLLWSPAPQHEWWWQRQLQKAAK